MTIEDDQLMMCKAQALVGQAVGTFLSERSIYMGNAQTAAGFTSAAPVNDKGRGTPKRLSVKMSTTATSEGAATLKVELVMADDEELTSNLKVLASSEAIALAQLVKGYQFRLSYLPVGITKKWLGLRFTVGTAEFTAGKVTAKLCESEAESDFVGAQG